MAERRRTPGERTRTGARPALAVGAVLLVVAAGGSAAAVPETESLSDKVSTPSAPSAADTLASDMAWAAEHARGSMAWAVTEAKRTGSKVVAYDETTATSFTVANPDGTLTTELTAAPERVWRGGKWETVDVTLTAGADGTVMAKRHPSGLRLAGAGGSAPASLSAAQRSAPRDLVTLGSGEGRVTLQWKGGLPRPVLKGTTARYHEAVPGADVIVEATRTGFEQYVEITRKPTGPYTYTLPVKAKGLAAKSNRDGSVSFTDTRTGRLRATMPAPVMWDSTVDKSSGEHTRRARVGMKVVDRGHGAVDLVITPSAAFLADPATAYPVTVDPSTSALANTFDTYVQHGETTDLSTDTELDLGNPGTHNPDGTARTARSYLTWNTTPIRDALIVDTNLALWNHHSGNTDCTAQGWTVWDTGAASTASRWTNQPAWLHQYHSSTQTRGNPGCTATQPDGWINADVDTLVQTWASARTTQGHMGLRAATDDTRAWKRVNSANNAAHQPKLTVTHNHRPSDGTRQEAGPPFKSYAGVWAVDSTTPTLRDTFTDPDGDRVNGTFQIYDAATNLPIVTPAGDGVVVSAYAASGTPVHVTVPAGQLKDGHTYKFRTNAYDGTHYNTSWSPWRQFVVDTTAPGRPTGVTSAVYPEDWGGGGAGTAGTFDVTTGTSDARDVQYRLDPFDNNGDGVNDDGAWHSVAASTGGQHASFAVTPPANGNHQVEVRTVDRADNAGPVRNYGFTAGNRDYNRAQKVDIKLPQPNLTAPDPPDADNPYPAFGWGGWEPALARNGAGAAPPLLGTESRTFKNGDATVTVTPRQQRSRAAASSIARAVERYGAGRSGGAAPAAGYTGPILDKSWCDPTLTAQKSYLTRTEACLIFDWRVTGQDGAVTYRQDFELLWQLKLDKNGDSVKHWVQMIPVFGSHMPGLPWPPSPKALAFTILATCGNSACVDGGAGFSWEAGRSSSWSSGLDNHMAQGNAETRWNGGVTNAAGHKDVDLSKDLPLQIQTVFSTDTPRMVVTDNHASSGVVSARCDKVYRTAGCVLPLYSPGYSVNARKYPAAAAHIWLIQLKGANLLLGATPVKPLHFLPGPERNATGYDKDKLSRPVMCAKSGSKRTDGWVPRKLFLNHPRTYMHPELASTGTPDSISCDEYPFAATYESPGMAGGAGGLMPAGPNGGGECVQTVALKADDGTEHLVDDTRYDPPAWTEKCGRSSMSGYVNSGSMSRMGSVGTNPFPQSTRLLDKDTYWVDPGTQHFEGCDPRQDVISCQMR
ncbi:DNRLRE domain-containing protein [Streptomyces sp. NPDC051018]|uniref:DNRLRE domain-containing protein n=1 Tax=Streptomyces sp. NPDC051018 TaxID=3365639 RepID=UPI0037B92A05